MPTAVFSEDMTSEAIYDRAMVLNPFAYEGKGIHEDPPHLASLG